MTSIKAVDIGLPLGGTVWYKNVQQNGPYVRDYHPKGGKMTPRGALIPAHNLQHNVFAVAERALQTRLLALAVIVAMRQQWGELL
jgi:hypothetical protein